MSRAKLPVVAIVGRANVGKSTLFNIISGGKLALVSSDSGTTRDTNEAVVEWRSTAFLLIDTGGLERKAEREVQAATVAQARKTIMRADRIVFVLDDHTGVTGDDRLIARELQQRKRQVVVVVNKVDSPIASDALDPSYYRLGFSSVMSVSAASGRGIGDLLDSVVAGLGTRTKPTPKPAIRLALIGKTNTGKSSIVNAVCGTDNVIVSGEPHTTREPRDIEVRFHGETFVFVDTAGMRKEHKVSDALERTANLMSARTVGQVDIAIVVTDVTQKLTMHDLHVVDVARKARVGLIIVANKWDLIGEKTPTTIQTFEKYYRHALNMVPWAPLIFTSAVTRQRLDDIFAAAKKIREAQLKQIPQEILDSFLSRLLRKNFPGQRLGAQKPRIFGLVQTGVDPQRFKLMVKEPRTLHPSFLQFAENRLREAFHFTGVPISLTLASVKEKHG